LPGVDLLVNPSLSEEMPNIVLEAMAVRVPVIATRVGGLEEMSVVWMVPCVWFLPRKPAI